MAFKRFLTFLLLLATAGGCSAQLAIGEEKPTAKPITKADKPREKMAQATFGGGCFWCTEAVFLALEGVEKVTSGYSGGQVENPTYREVCMGTTGHAEVIHIEYDPEKVTFQELLEVHLKTHDPTTLNRQGNDIGTQYRSAVFYHTDEQKKLAETAIDELNKAGAYENPIVTEVTEFEKFWPAEDYHQNYLAENPNQGYCRLVVQPKVDKFRKVFKDKLKKEEAK
ncbi:peptide-methionine (S)-S-oxide reductase MsrA [Aeoliella sp.]|uniref:peptide-methionine (S)-S-oxide reductase MsrA n=1 Tax=Aeoliella sp. TaxID=2795800 RepID=UPI003CCBE634